MIKSFKCKETEKVWNEIFSKKLPHDIQKRALQKLRMLHVACVLDDLKTPPSNHLEALTGDRQGRHSIRINNQYRICFR
ncbi:type II toxin-antitoxin system RelE/ParE family toxin, partial [bacterium]|nr:type II toxin-antitoxin system RelE/ParE family toxin [bacterium]